MQRHLSGSALALGLAALSLFFAASAYGLTHTRVCNSIGGFGECKDNVGSQNYHPWSQTKTVYIPNDPPNPPTSFQGTCAIGRKMDGINKTNSLCTPYESATATFDTPSVQCRAIGTWRGYGPDQNVYIKADT